MKALADDVNNDGQLHSNLEGIADWSTSYPFINFFKMSRPWLSGPLV
jgi:hypothetical protein